MSVVVFRHPSVSLTIQSITPVDSDGLLISVTFYGSIRFVKDFDQFPETVGGVPGSN